MRKETKVSSPVNNPAAFVRTLLLAIVCLISAGGAAAQAVSQPLLFITNRDGNFEVYKMGADGSNQQRLTNTTESEGLAKWSANGQKIFYGKSLNTAASQIWVMNADGSNPTLITSDNLISDFQVSPNGQKILFVKGQSNVDDKIWVMNADGSNKVQLTNTAMADHVARWSPDNTKIAFGRCNPTSHFCDLFTMNADGSNQTNLTPNNADDDDGAQWTPDGSKIVYNAGDGADNYNLYIINANGTNRQPLTNFVGAPFPSGAFIAPNGNTVGFSAQSGLITSFEVYTVGIGGGTPVNLTNNTALDVFSAWSPDSAKIAFRSRRDTATEEVYVMNANGSNVVRLTNNTAIDSVTDWYKPSVSRARFDFDGDGKADVSVFRPSSGAWYLQQSTAGFTGAAFGLNGDKIVPADYDGDGKTDLAVFRGGTWYLQRSTLGFTGIGFGSADDLPRPADFDGDGKADLCVFRPSNGTWYYLNSSNGQFVGAGFGLSGDAPVPADYDGDGKADLAVFRNGTWYLQRSQLGFTGIGFGQTGDIPVQADYDGDGKADIAVFRAGTWYLNRSTAGFTGVGFGLSTDIPTAADYDGDGKADIAVFRPSAGAWYLQQTTAGFTGFAFGTNGDQPIPAAFLP